MTIQAGNLFAVKTGNDYVAMMEKFLLKVFSDAQGTLDSSVAAGHYRPCGNSDWEVEWTAKGGLPAVFPNDTFTFGGVIQTDGSTAQKRAYGRMRCKQIEINVQTSEQGAYVWHTVKAGGAPTTGGSNYLQYDSTAIAADTTAPVMACASGLGIDVDGAAQDNVEWSKLIIAADFEPYVDSGVSGWYQRSPGNIDWALSYRRKFALWSELPTVDQVAIIKQYTTTLLFWELKYGKFTRPVDVTFDRKAKTPVAATIICEMMGGTTSGTGYIKAPGVVTAKWPASYT